MAVERKPDQKRGGVAFIFVIVLGLIIGIFLKRVQLGLIIGLALGLLGSNMLRRR
ncbi:MAG TPA: hypothetical protein VHK91_07090 [Flavisolibacter sp.]|jgi:hypothetical protein|nr:hypothetical protein [Flavisolibacter sp.]